MRIIGEQEFAAEIRRQLLTVGFEVCDFVTGPGRSGAIAAVYASHILGIPFIPQGAKPPPKCHRLLVIDTAMESGATMRKAMRELAMFNPVPLAVYMEPPRVAFWYEAQKPQMYRHEMLKRVA